MTTRSVLILGILMTGHAVAQTKPAAPAMDAPAKPELAAADIGRLVVLRGAGGAEGGDAMTPPDLPAGTPLHMVAPRGGDTPRRWPWRAGRTGAVSKPR